MIILKELATPQDMRFTPYPVACDKIILRDENTNTEIEYLVTPTIDRYYLLFNEIWNIKEDTYYQLKAYNGTDLVYRDRVFCTNQELPNYSVNKDQYIQHSSNDDFIIYE